MERERAIRIFICLSDASRLNIVSLLKNGEAYGELLAEQLDLSASTLSFHMKKLEEAGLVKSRKDQYYTVYSLDPSLSDMPLSELMFDNSETEFDAARQREDEYRKRALDSFFDGEKLRSIPVQRKKKLIVLQKIAESFIIGQIYGEAELSEIISRVYPDYCTIRKDMISEGIFARDCGEYVRIK